MNPNSIAPAAQRSPRPGRGRPRFSVDTAVIARCRATARLVEAIWHGAGAEAPALNPAGAARPCHVRQLAIYVAHVALSIPYGALSTAFSLDRTTVTHACQVVEERRDDPAYDRFAEHCERCAAAALLPDPENGDAEAN